MESREEKMQKFEQQLRKQIEDTYKQVWCDLLHDKVKQTPPDYDWIVKLYKEIRWKLIFFLKQGSPFRVEIEEGMDVELFDQMIRHGAFQGPEFVALVEFVFDKCLKLGSPARDNDVKEFKQEVMTALQNKATFAELVPLFFKNANTAADWIQEDLFGVKQNLERLVKEGIIPGNKN